MRVYSAPVLANVALLKDVLEMHGIAAEVRGEDRGAAGPGAIPATEAWVELWVLDQARVAEAERIIQEALKSPAEPPPSWICSRCHEEVDGGFADCWNCGTERQRGPET